MDNMLISPVGLMVRNIFFPVSHFNFFSILFTFLLGWYGWYEENERCYWGIYAPGAQKLRFQLINDFEVR